MKSNWQIPFGISIMAIGFDLMPLPLEEWTGLRWLLGGVIFVMGAWIIAAARSSPIK